MPIEQVALKGSPLPGDWLTETRQLPVKFTYGYVAVLFDKITDEPQDWECHGPFNTHEEAVARAHELRKPYRVETVITSVTILGAGAGDRWTRGPFDRILAATRERAILEI